MTPTVGDRQVVGVGSVKKASRRLTHKQYSLYTNAISFRTVRDGTQNQGLGEQLTDKGGAFSI